MRILLSLLTILLFGCGEPINVDESSTLLSQSEIGLQRTAWNINRAGSGYTIDVRRNCSCIRPSDFYSNYRISTDSVNNRVLIESLDEDGNPGIILPDNSLYYPNLEEIFDKVEAELSNGNPVVGFFDVDEGYPTRIEFGVTETYWIEVVGYF